MTPKDLPSADSARIAAEIVGPGLGTDPFVAAVRATRMPMIITDPKLPDNPVAFANDAFCKLTGYAREEIVGRNCRFLQGPGTDPDTARRIHDAVKAGQSIQVDILNYRKSGDQFWNRLLLAPVKDAGGKLSYFFASQVDVTLERERLFGLESKNAALTAEIAARLRDLSDSEERLKLATQAGEIGVWELDLASGALMTSALCRDNFGRDPALPFPYEELRAAVHPDDRARMLAAVKHSIETGEDYRIEYRAVRPDERTAWVQVSARVQHNDEGTPIRMVGTSREVTEVRGAAQRSQLLLELDRSVFGALDDPLEIAYLAAASLGKLLEVSRAGYGTIDETDGLITIEREWRVDGSQPQVDPPRSRACDFCVEELMRGAVVTIDDASEDFRTSLTADRLIDGDAQSQVLAPVLDAGEVAAVVYLAHDQARHWSPDEVGFIREIATRVGQAVERHRTALELRALADSLAAQVHERSAQLLSAESALRQSQKMEAVGQLTGGLAHDFNNLLAAISGSLEVLQRKRPDPASAEFERMVNIGRSATKKAAALTHRLLAFSRQQALQPKRLDINRMVLDIEDLVRRTIGPGIQLDVHVAADLWRVEVDPSQLENSLLNLCINARDAMPEGGRLTIETGNRWIDDITAQRENIEPGAYVSMCVADDGVGMLPHVLVRAFDPFFTTKPVGLGTGLGLSMVYGFAKQSEGYARIQSEPGYGTTVCLYLPRKDGEDQAGDDRVEEADAAVGAGDIVLIVEDEDDVRELVASTLQDAGYRVLEASDGSQATALLQSVKRIDLLVTDVGLKGGMNGRQVADAARVSRSTLPVIFITGYAEGALLKHGRLEAGLHVLTKPFPLTELVSKVAFVLEAYRAGN